jgi:hypothetical protein
LRVLDAKSETQCTQGVGGEMDNDELRSDEETLKPR